MSSIEKERSVWQNSGENYDGDEASKNLWFYTSEHNFTYGPYETEAEATERMQLHGIEE